jgi:hypothetical protein
MTMKLQALNDDFVGAYREIQKDIIFFKKTCRHFIPQNVSLLGAAKAP